MSQTLYRFYDADGALLYIGVTMDPPVRWKAHADVKEWWATVRNIKMEPFETRTEVLAAERAAIKAERPRYNVIHNGQDHPVVERDGEMYRRVRDLLQVGSWVMLETIGDWWCVGYVSHVERSWVHVQPYLEEIDRGDGDGVVDWDPEVTMTIRKAFIVDIVARTAAEVTAEPRVIGGLFETMDERVAQYHALRFAAK